jgi:hypothetical protein
VDVSAYYGYSLKSAGIRVHYCSGQFENDGTMSFSVLKTLKRSMAAEYSRDLSVKMFSGQCRLVCVTGPDQQRLPSAPKRTVIRM